MDKLRILYWCLYAKDAFQHNAKLLDALCRIEVYPRSAASWILQCMVTPRPARRKGNTLEKAKCPHSAISHPTHPHETLYLCLPNGWDPVASGVRSSLAFTAFVNTSESPYASSDNPNTWLLWYQLARREAGGAIKGQLHPSCLSLPSSCKNEHAIVRSNNYYPF